MSGAGLLPRAARVALWAGAAVAGRASWDQVVDAASRGDERHTAVHEPAPPTTALPGLEAAPPPEPPRDVPGGLLGLLATLRTAGVRELRAVLPAPGDAIGLPGPAPVTSAAVEAGEAVVADADGVRWVLVPAVTRFGSALEPGHVVRWRMLDADPRPVPGVVQLADADRELRGGLLEAIDELSRLDVARWRDEAAADLEFVRSGALPGWLLPPGTGARQVAVLSSALKVRVIVGLARRDDGGSLGAWDAGRRDDVLRRLDGIARRAIAAACSEPTTR